MISHITQNGQIVSYPTAESSRLEEDGLWHFYDRHGVEVGRQSVPVENEGTDVVELEPEETVGPPLLLADTRVVVASPESVVEPPSTTPPEVSHDVIPQ
jgi:hypothetical protein